MSESTIKVIDIKIFPNRLLNADTSEKLLDLIYEIDGIIRGFVHGPSLPKKIAMGPGKGLPINHPDRKTINVQGEDIDLRVKVGEIILTVDVSKINEIIDQLDNILKENMPCDYSLMVGTFSKHEITTSDYLKYGEKFQDIIDNRFIGLVDGRSKSSETVKIIK